MILNILLFIIGIAGLIKGADLFVTNASGIARRLNVPGLIIGLTIVALGTSAPELAVSVTAAVQGSNELAFSNVVGSNMLNLLAILGVCALIKPIPVDVDILRRDFPFSIAVTITLLVITCGSIFHRRRMLTNNMERDVGTASQLDGVFLVTLLILYILMLIISAKKKTEGVVEKPVSEDVSMGKTILLLILGIAMIVGGGEAVVYSAREIARAAGLSEAVIGMTVVAFGTSLPELVTSVVAARKGEVSMAIGNVIGSNIFNILFILGASALIHPIDVTAGSAIDMIILIAMNVLMFFFAASDRKITRVEGGVMVGLYIIEVVYAFFR